MAETIPRHYLWSMSKTPKRPRDMMQLAKLVGEIATGEAVEVEQPQPDPDAVERGNARAAKLSARKRKEIAKKGAAARWERKK